MNLKNGERPLSLDLQQFDFTKKVRFGAKQVGRAISAHPELIDTVYSGLDTVIYQAQAQGRQDILQAVGTFNSLLLTEVDSFEWTKIKDLQLTPEQARVLLANLPEAKSDKKRSTKELLAMRVIKGVLSDRFEDPKKPDWRGVVETFYAFYKSAVEPEVDEDLVMKWAELYTLQHPTFIGLGSLPWRATSLALTKVDIADRKYLKMGSELANAARIVRPTLGLTENDEEEKERAKCYRLHLMALMEVVKEGVDPLTSLGKDKYRVSLAGLIGVGKRLPIPFPITGDLVELVEDQQRNPHIVTQMALVEQSSAVMFHNPIQLNYPDPRVQAVAEAKYAVTPALRALYQTFYPAYQQSVRDVVYEEQSKGKAVVPFALRGMAGYMISEPGKQLSLSEIAHHVSNSNYINSEGFRVVMSNINAISTNMRIGDVTLCFLRPEFAEKSAVSTYLETVIPEEYSQNSVQVLKDNRARKDAGKKVTRIPTTSGDLYPLSESLSWGQVVDRAVLRKVKGGIGFTIRFTDRHRMLLQQEKSISGIVTAKKGLVRVRFTDGTPQLAASQKWILENLVLRLFERSCTPSLTEAEWESTQRNEHPDLFSTDIPAYITHIGVKKADGSPGTHTKYAEGNLQQARADLQLEFPGTSLEEINTWHKETNPTDKRNVTFNKGRDLPEGHPPSRRSLPDVLVVPIDTGTQN